MTVRVHTEFIGDRPPPPAEVMAEVSRHMHRGATEAGDILQSAVRGAMSVNAKSGRSMHSVTAEVDTIAPDHLELTVGSADPAVKFMTDGTGIYGPKKQPIRPVSSRVLRFPHRGIRYGGQVRIVGDHAYAFWVRGVRPRNYFENAYETTKAFVGAVFDRTASRIEAVI